MLKKTKAQLIGKSNSATARCTSPPLAPLPLWCVPALAARFPRVFCLPPSARSRVALPLALRVAPCTLSRPPLSRPLSPLSRDAPFLRVLPQLPCVLLLLLRLSAPSRVAACFCVVLLRRVSHAPNSPRAPPAPRAGPCRTRVTSRRSASGATMLRAAQHAFRALAVCALLVLLCSCQTSAKELPPLPPQCSSAIVDGELTVICQGFPMSEPNCETLGEKLCCPSQLPANMAMLTQYLAAANCTSLLLKCTGHFGGGDAAWCAILGSELNALPPLKALTLDVSENNLCGDGVVHVLANALSSSPALEALSFSANLGNISDAGATALATALLQKPAGRSIMNLAIDLSFNDKADNDDKPITAKGAGALGRAVGAMLQLRSLSINMSLQVQLGAEGVLALSAGLLPLRAASHLAYVELQLGMTMLLSNKTGSDAAMACLGSSLGGLSALTTLVLNLDADVGNAAGVFSMGSRLACLDVAAIDFPLFDAATDCHCGVLLDRSQQCLRANQDYPELGPYCFNCTTVPSCT